jgi:AsmA protein
VRTVKILAGVVGGLIGLLVAALLAVWLTVNPNDYKGRIAAAVKESTGRDLVLKGDIKLTMFPWVALALGPASLGNPPGFGTEPFLAFNRAAVRVRLFPLLARRLEMDRIDIDGLDLRLRRNEAGIGNWQSFRVARTPAANAGGVKITGQTPQLAGIRITHGRVSYEAMVIDKLTFETGAFGGPGVTPISIAFDANRGRPEETLSVKAQFDFSMGPQPEHLRLDAVSLSGFLGRPGDGRTPWELSAPLIEMDLSGQAVAVPAFAASYANAHLSGRVQATKVLDDPGAMGSVALAPLLLHEFAPRFGIVLPPTRDPRALAQLSASSDFSYSADGVRLEQLQAQLDDTHLKGSAALAGEPRALKFELTVDQINVDRYLSPENAPAAAKAHAAPAGEPAKTLDADGTLALAAVHFSPLDFSNVRVTVASKDNVVHLYPSLAQIDGGNYSGNITLDRRGAAPTLSLDEHLKGIDMTRLLAGSAYKGRMSGRGNVNVKATAHGAGFNAFMQTLNGHFDANLADGALEGVDLGYEIGQAQALIKHTPEPARSNPPRTRFDAFKMSAEITNGMARTSDLTISSPVVRVTAQGSANLVNKALDMQMLASALKAPGVSAADIPLKITGTYADPVVRPDAEALAKGALKQKLQDVLKKNGLEGLFGK